MAFDWELVDHPQVAPQPGQGARGALSEVWRHLYAVAWILAMYCDKQSKGGPRPVASGKQLMWR
jgi:hypothetical protein